MIDTLGQNNHYNTVFPASYIFYMLVVSDETAFKNLALVNEKKKYSGRSYQFMKREEYKGKSSINQYNPESCHESIQYYMVVAMFIASKYH